MSDVTERSAAERPASRRCGACGVLVAPDATFCHSCGASVALSTRDARVLARLAAAFVGRYVFERKLGQGGMGSVYLAQDLKLKRPVAFKVLRPEIAPLLGVQRFQREIAVVSTLQHPHILPLYDSGEVAAPGEDPLLYYVMPYVAGESLRARLDREKQLPLEDALALARDVAGALDYAHRQGIVHRDIKPENILLAEQQAIVADFGIARAVGAAGGDRLTETGMSIGTPAYMSPEQSTGEADIDGRSDIYSLGCVLYEMLAGETPYTGRTAQALIAKRLSAPIPHLGTLREELPPHVERAVRKSLAKVPADRFATAAQFLAALGTDAPTGAGEAAAAKAPPRSRTRMAWLVSAAVLVLVALGLGWRALRAPREPPPATRVRVAVLPFAPHGGEDARRLSGAMVNLLGTVLDGAGGLRTVDVAAVLTAAGDHPSQSPADARAIARRLGAGRYIQGDVVEGAPGRFTVSASVHDTDADSAERQRAAVEGPGADVFRLVNELAVQLLGSLGVQQSPRRLESMSTSSAVALKEYLAGETLMRRGEYAQAAEAFGRAVQADSLFALAWFRQGYAYGFTERSDRGEQPLARALALRQRLSERDRRLAEALGALTAGDPEQAVRLYSALVYDYPDDVEGWFGRADAVLHYGPLYGLRMDSVSQAFERVLYLDPNHSEAQVHLPWAAGLEGRIGLVDSAAARIIAADSAGYYAPVFRLLRAFAVRDSAALGRALAASGKMDDLQRLLAVNMSATLRDPPATARLTRRLLTDSSRIAEVRGFGHLLLAHLALAGGHARAASRELAAADSLDPAAALEDRALVALLPFLRTPDSTLRLVRAQVERWDAARVPPSASGNAWLVPHDSLHAPIRLYLLGALSARLRDAPGAARAAAELRRLDSTTAAGAIGRSFADAVLAQSELAEGRPAEALGGFDAGRMGGRYARSWERAYSSPFFSQSYERYLRAGALAGIGRDADALRWYGSLWMANAFDLVYLAPAQLEAAALYERAGDRARALAAYRAFVELWRDADPELRPAVERARARIAALEK